MSQYPVDPPSDTFSGHVGSSHRDEESRSILDQVDEYLNEQDYDAHDAGAGAGAAPHAAHWIGDSMQLDLDDLGSPALRHDAADPDPGARKDASGGFKLDYGLHAAAAAAAQPPQLHHHHHHHHLSHTHAHALHDDSDDQGARQPASHQHVRPDMVFSPMVSPLVAPGQQLQNTPFMSAGLPQASSVKDARPSFSPLSSPALSAGDRALNAHAHSSSFTLPEASSSASTKRSSSACSRSKRTPHSTPALTATTSSKVVKQSPQINSRRAISSKVKSNSSNWDDMFALPDSSIPPPAGSSTASGYATTATASAAANSSSALEDGTPRPVSSTASSAGSTGPTNPSQPHITPATLMNYPKVILPSNNSANYGVSSLHEDRNVIRATESPVIKPKHPSSHLSRQTSNTSLHAKSTPELKPRRKSSKSSLNDSGPEEEVFKKEVHKAAEQGRRNRLNTALSDLQSLIPSELRETVLIPSKATTVELACQYIRQLTGQLDQKEE